MTMMRDNPLPIGKYWVDVFDPDRMAFRGWLADHSDTLYVEKQEDKLARGGYPAETWYLFSVLSPTPWNGPGFPTIADEAVQTQDDTSQKPPPPPSISDQTGEVIDSVEHAAEVAASAVKTGLVIGGIGLAGWFLVKLLGK